MKSQILNKYLKDNCGQTSQSQSYWWIIRSNNIVFACFNCTSHFIYEKPNIFPAYMTTKWWRNLTIQNSNITSFFRFANKRVIYSDCKISLAHARWKQNTYYIFRPTILVNSYQEDSSSKYVQHSMWYLLAVYFFNKIVRTVMVKQILTERTTTSHFSHWSNNFA
jgi:hypothetical protein